MDTHVINSLTDLFRKFPGIGARQARRFVYFLLNADQEYLELLTTGIKNLKVEINQCEKCQRHFSQKYRQNNHLCKICADETRDATVLMLVEKDIDLDALERAGTYRGYYFVLGGNVPILDPNPESKIRFPALIKQMEDRFSLGLQEIIIALSATSEGDHTSEWLSSKLEPLKQKTGLKITHLGRGLSTGSELEYADADTLKNALRNRQ